MLTNIVIFLILIAVVVLFAWLARRAWKPRRAWLKWPAIVLAGLLTLLFALVSGVFAKLDFIHSTWRQT